MGWNKKSEIWQWVLLSGVPVLITVVAIFLVVVVEMKPKPQFVEGGLYASPRQEGSGYNIIKVLMIDDNGYHIRSYSNVFREVPVVLVACQDC